MHVIQGRVRDYDWGSPDLIPRFFGLPPADFPVAELWLGAHRAAPARCDVGAGARALSRQDLSDGGQGVRSRAGAGADLRDYIAADPQGSLSAAVAKHHGGELPFLLKLIAPAQPLSLQVHPSTEQARVGYQRENAKGIELDAWDRSYKDENHKPELVYAITKFDALVGFRTPRRILGVLEGLDARLTQEIAEYIRKEPNAHGVRNAFASLLLEDSRPGADPVAEVVEACAERLTKDSPSPRADDMVGTLAAHYPGDPGIVASLLLNPVTLKPGEAMFTPAGTVHAYAAGFGLEIMANSDNVLRAGLTNKFVDVKELLAVVETVAAPPIRIAPERISPIQSTFYAPVDDFELSIIELRNAGRTYRLSGGGPRIIASLDGAADLWVESGQHLLVNTGQAVFVRADDGPAKVRGIGRFVQASVP
ncbi:mannose-6-phosphate isomerase [Trueperella bonasi]|uniref:mannose-6-phosphate isomerase n=1 Tax=Trueperella bonasi TaxID=312286 RepID=A0ABT9NFM0_9ACTO|nr:mannose-6-phosphate isomerase, class I [Trueperella bonasi]MDP9806181.1 mannose-6-phosphate isomerase [Trueperella bonasi]